MPKCTNSTFSRNPNPLDSLCSNSCQEFASAFPKLIRDTIVIFRNDSFYINKALFGFSEIIYAMTKHSQSYVNVT